MSYEFFLDYLPSKDLGQVIMDDVVDRLLLSSLEINSEGISLTGDSK